MSTTSDAAKRVRSGRLTSPKTQPVLPNPNGTRRERRAAKQLGITEQRKGKL